MNTLKSDVEVSNQGESVQQEIFPLLKLPEELIIHIVHSLGFREWGVLARVSKFFLDLTNRDVLWRRYYPRAKFSATKFRLKAVNDYKNSEPLAQADQVVVGRHYDKYVMDDFFRLLGVIKRDRAGITCGVVMKCSNELRDDRDFMLVAVRKKGLALKYASNEFKNNYDLILAVVRHNGLALQYASEALKADQEVVLTAVSQNGNALQYASDGHKDSHEIVLAAVGQFGYALHHASDELIANREIVLAAVKQNGWALQYASDELRADREIVLAAVSQYGCALRSTSDELKGDREIVLAAVRQNEWALDYVSDELKGDREIVLAAARGTLSSYGLTANRLGLFAVSIGALTGLAVILNYQYGDDSYSRLEL